MTRVIRSLVLIALVTAAPHAQNRATALPAAIELRDNWLMEDAALVRVPGAPLSMSPFVPPNTWSRATVPGTMFIAESERPMSYWYRTEVMVPAEFAARRVWLNFDGIKSLADVWVNGKQIGEIRGTFARGLFDITTLVTPGSNAVVAVLIAPSPASEDRHVGIWQRVTLFATGPVVIDDPYVRTDLPLPRKDTADVSIQVPLRNASVRSQTGILHGRLGDVSFSFGPMTLAPDESRILRFSPTTVPALRIRDPKLWWPNGFGAPDRYPLELTFEADGGVSDVKTMNIGLRSVEYRMSDSKYLTLVVNGVPVFAKGARWDLDESLRRIPRERLEAQMRLHREANLTIVRNPSGQSTSEDFYDLADRYGLMVWDDVPRSLENVREKVLRFRNHPSIVVWGGGSEDIAAIVRELDPSRTHQPDAGTDGTFVPLEPPAGSVVAQAAEDRAARLANYDVARGLYESRFDRLFNPTRGVISGKNNVYSNDLEPSAGFFGTRRANETIHIQLNQSNGHVMAINHLGETLYGFKYRVRVINLDGKVVLNRRLNTGMLARSAAADLGAIAFPAGTSPVHFVKLELFDGSNDLVSENFYWRNGHAGNDFRALNNLPLVGLEATLKRRAFKDKTRVILDVTLENPGKVVALMAHLQLRSDRTKARILPVYYSDNYVSLLPGERRGITVEVAAKDLGSDQPVIAIDGWNVARADAKQPR